MKILFIFLLLNIFIFSGSYRVFSQEYGYEDYSNNENSYHGYGWENLINRFNENTFGKPITPKEFEEAIKTIKKYSKNKKKKKKKRKHKKNKNQKEEFQQKGTSPEKPLTVDRPASSSRLFRLSSDVIYNNKVINNGFYLVDLLIEDKNYYIVLKQGYNTIIKIKSSVINDKKAFEGKKENVFLEVFDSKLLKIYYRSLNIIVESDYLFYAN